MECKKLYTDVLRAENCIGEVADRFYGEKEGGFHRLYIGEILNTWVTEQQSDITVIEKRRV